jgi:DNA-binding transcriptional MerR regulator
VGWRVPPQRYLASPEKRSNVEDCSEARQERIEGDLAVYRKATKHVNVPQDFSAEDVFEMGKIVDRARETSSTAGVMMTYGENMPDYYFEPETLRAVASYSAGKDALASRINSYASVYIEDVAMTAPILDRFVELTPSLASGPESARPTLLDIARARRSGCSVEEIAEIVQTAPAASSAGQGSEESVHALRDALLVSRTLRQARRDGVSKETLEVIAPLVVERPHSTKKTNPLNAGDEKEVRWLLDLVASHPAALERLSKYVGKVSMQENEEVDQMLHELAAEFGEVPETLGGLLPTTARRPIRFVI